MRKKIPDVGEPKIDKDIVQYLMSLANIMKSNFLILLPSNSKYCMDVEGIF